MAWRGPTQPTTNPIPNAVMAGLEMSGHKRSENRATAVRRDTDTFKNLSISLIDVDSTIFYHMNDTVNPQIVDNGHLIKVPINYASPERWVAIKKDGYMRDKQGKVQCPAIAFSRTTMQRNDQLITFNRHLSMPFLRSYSEKNKYDKFGLMNKFAPVKEIHLISMPDHVIVTYDFTIWTEKIEQQNSIVEKINWATEEYWGDKKRFKFRTSIADYNFQTEVPADQDRMVKATFSIMVYAYLLPETFEDYRSTTQKYFSKRKIVFNTEVVTRNGEVVGAKSVSRKNPVTNSEILDVNDYVDRTDFSSGEGSFNEVWSFQSEYQTKTGSVVTVDNGSGSSVFMFTSSSFNYTGSPSPDYKRLTLFVDDVAVKDVAANSYESGSSIFVVVNNTYSKITPTTGSIVVGYGNIQ